MSRSQQSGVISTAEGNSGVDQTAATNALTAENADIGNYQAQLSKFAASNPYTEGGEYQANQNKTLSAVADAGSGAIQNQAQTQAQRTGQNAGAAVAGGIQTGMANQRALSADEAAANDQRIGDEAGYSDKVLGATAVPAEIEQGIYGTSLNGANGALNTAGGSAQTPGFFDTLGDTFAAALGKTAGTGR